MNTRLPITVLLWMSLLAPAVAQELPKGPTLQPDRQSAVETPDDFGVFKTVGHYWVALTLSSRAGATTPEYRRYEVVEVFDDRATVKVEVVDPEYLTLPGMAPWTETVFFDRNPRLRGLPEGLEPIIARDEEVWIGALTQHCLFVQLKSSPERASDTITVQRWMSLDRPGLVLLEMRHGPDRTELTKVVDFGFHAPDEDEQAPAGAPAPADGAR